MSLLLQPERRLLSSRLLYAALYLLLSVGASTMVYPFLLMVSGSVKSRVDATDFDLIPRFLYDDELLYRKYIEAKYSEDLQVYREVTADEVRSFREVQPPPRSAGLVADWREFCQRADLPPSWYLTGFGPTLEGRIIQRNERAFRNHLKALCDDDLDRFRSRFDEPIENWFFLKFRPERLTDRTYQVSDTPLMAAFYAFKETLPLADRIYVSCDGAYARYVRLHWEAEGPQPVLSAQPQPGLWESFVRESLHPQFINVGAAARPQWQAFLQRKYGDVAHLNKLYGSDYTDFARVPFPADRLKASAELTDYLLFLADPESLPLACLSVDTPELRWRAFLRAKYPSLGEVARRHGRAYASFDSIPMPQREADHEYCLTHAGQLRREFLATNFRMVLEYLLFYGRGIRNTVIYCLLAIALALVVNPLAAYALSRFNLPGQYRILLFLIATMAFPGVVTMIPNFLLLRDLGLLNTFAALLLPAMANGYSIFLLKGFFDTLPRELFEAADIDGAGEWQKFWLIAMNLSKPVLAVIALGAFNGAYSNFMYAFILCQDRSMWTMMVWLYQLQQFSSQGVVFASLLIAAVPTLLVFVLCQNIIIRGIVVPTEK